MNFCAIKNWKDVVEQFGVQPVDGYLNAKQISKELSKRAQEYTDTHVGYDISLGTKTEAIALFRIVSVVDNNITFEYEGTAS